MYLIRERFFRLGEDSDITDEHGRPVLHVDGKVLNLRNRLIPRDPKGREVAQVQRELVAMRPLREPVWLARWSGIRSPQHPARPLASACSRPEVLVHRRTAGSHGSLGTMIGRAVGASDLRLKWNIGTPYA
jgi:hypothetical protein